MLLNLSRSRLVASTSNSRYLIHSRNSCNELAIRAICFLVSALMADSFAPVLVIVLFDFFVLVPEAISMISRSL